MGACSDAFIVLLSLMMHTMHHLGSWRSSGPACRVLCKLNLQALGQSGTSVAQPSSTAVVVGIASAEYNNTLVPRYTAGVSAFSATGGALSVASGRLRCGQKPDGTWVAWNFGCTGCLLTAVLRR